MSKDEGEFLSGAVPDEPLWGKASNLGRLDQRVTNMEAALKEIKGEFRSVKDDFRSIRDEIMAIHRAVLSIGKPQYAVISGFAGVVLLGASLLWGLAISPIKDDISRLYALSEKVAIKVDDNEKLLDAKKVDSSAIEGLRADLKSRIEELNARLKRQ